MLTKSPITTMLPVADMDRAARFYGQTLGLEERAATPDGGRVFPRAAMPSVCCRPNRVRKAGTPC